MAENNTDIFTPWASGDKVSTSPEHVWVYDGTERKGLMGKHRAGTVIEVPLATRAAGRGALLVRWDSLTGTPLSSPDWWTHSDLIVRSK